MKTIAISPDALQEAARVLAGGGIVAYPTESFYALGARHDAVDALERLERMKGRADGKPFGLVTPDIKALEMVAHTPDVAQLKLMGRHWPGQLTILFLSRKGTHRLLAPTGLVAIRVPGPSAALDLARQCGFPFTATSANPSGRKPPTTAEAVAGYFSSGDGPDIILDGGETPGGEPSTVLEIAQGGRLNVIRWGAVEIGPEDMG